MEEKDELEVILDQLEAWLDKQLEVDKRKHRLNELLEPDRYKDIIEARAAIYLIQLAHALNDRISSMADKNSMNYLKTHSLMKFNIKFDLIYTQHKLYNLLEEICRRKNLKFPF